MLCREKFKVLGEILIYFFIMFIQKELQKFLNFQLEIPFKCSLGLLLNIDYNVVFIVTFFIVCLSVSSLICVYVRPSVSICVNLCQSMSICSVYMGLYVSYLTICASVSICVASVSFESI